MKKTFPYSEIIIRPASFNDIPFIREIALHTWPETYKEILSAEQMDYMLGQFYTSESLHKQIEDGHHFFLALIDFKPAGFASFTHEGNDVYKLQKLYVQTGLQHSGIGKKLLQSFEDAAATMGAKSLILNVNRHNKAKSFYEKNGYAVAKEVDVPIGQGYFMNDFIMEKNMG